MIRYLSNYLGGIQPVFIDGLLYFLIAVFGFVVTFISSDDAAKWVSPALLFWLKGTFGSALAGVSALKMFRSTSFGEHQEKKRKNGDTTIIPKP